MCAAAALSPLQGKQVLLSSEVPNGRGDLTFLKKMLDFFQAKGANCIFAFQGHAHTQGARFFAGKEVIHHTEIDEQRFDLEFGGPAISPGIVQRRLDAQKAPVVCLTEYGHDTHGYLKPNPFSLISGTGFKEGEMGVFVSKVPKEPKLPDWAPKGKFYLGYASQVSSVRAFIEAVCSFDHDAKTFVILGDHPSLQAPEGVTLLNREVPPEEVMHFIAKAEPQILCTGNQFFSEVLSRRDAVPVFECLGHLKGVWRDYTAKTPEVPFATVASGAGRIAHYLTFCKENPGCLPDISGFSLLDRFEPELYALLEKPFETKAPPKAKKLGEAFSKEDFPIGKEFLISVKDMIRLAIQGDRSTVLDCTFEFGQIDPSTYSYVIKRTS